MSNIMTMLGNPVNNGAFLLFGYSLIVVLIACFVSIENAIKNKKP